MFLRHLKKKRILIPIIILITVIGIFTVPKGPEKITIIEVEDGQPTIERELVYFDVDPNKQKEEEAPVIKTQEIITPKLTETKPLENSEIVIEQEEEINCSIELRLTGILFDEDDSSAIIEIDGNDYVVKVGDRVGKFDILGISKNRIYIKDPSKNYTLTLGEVVFLSSLLKEGDLC